METSDTLGKKLDLILSRLDEQNKLLKKVLKLTEEDSPARAFMLNLLADLTGTAISGSSK